MRGERPSLLLPIRYRPVAFDTQTKQRSGRHDTRLGKAIFLGSATGWDKGHRHSLSRLRLSHPDQVTCVAAESCTHLIVQLVFELSWLISISHGLLHSRRAVHSAAAKTLGLCRCTQACQTGKAAGSAMMWTRRSCPNLCFLSLESSS